MTETIQVIDKWIKTDDDNELFTKTWKPSETKANLVMVHGFGEHIARYDRLFTLFAKEGIECYGWDQRGWGETAKKSAQFGNNQSYKKALDDINDAVVKNKNQDIPLFLIGHSMGGGLILNYLARSSIYKGVSLLTGAIASAPLVTLSMKISAVKYYTIRTLSAIVPSMTIKAGIDSEGMSHDQDEINDYLQDPLVHDYVTLATLRSFIDAGTDILETQAKNINTPILYSHADTDPINSYEATQEAFKLTSSTDKELKNWPGLKHELHNETAPQRTQIAEYYIDWIKNRSSSGKPNKFSA